MRFHIEDSCRACNADCQKKQEGTDVSPYFAISPQISILLAPLASQFLLQLSNELRKRDSRWFCERWYEKSILDGQAEIFFIDTNPFILDYHYQEWSNNTGQ